MRYALGRREQVGVSADERRVPTPGAASRGPGMVSRMKQETERGTYGHLVPGKILGGILAAVDGGRVVIGLVLDGEGELLQAVGKALCGVDLLVGRNAVEVHHCPLPGAQLDLLQRREKEVERARRSKKRRGGEKEREEGWCEGYTWGRQGAPRWKRGAERRQMPRRRAWQQWPSAVVRHCVHIAQWTGRAVSGPRPPPRAARR